MLPATSCCASPSRPSSRVPHTPDTKRRALLRRDASARTEAGPSGSVRVRFSRRSATLHPYDRDVCGQRACMCAHAPRQTAHTTKAEAESVPQLAASSPAATRQVRRGQPSHHSSADRASWDLSSGGQGPSEQRNLWRRASRLSILMHKRPFIAHMIVDTMAAR